MKSSLWKFIAKFADTLFLWNYVDGGKSEEDARGFGERQD